MILTNDKKIYQYCKEYHDHGHMNLKNISRGNDRARIHGFNYRGTEFQGAIGKVQLKKLDILLKDNKKKYFIIERYLSKKFQIRKIHSNTKPNFDTFIFYEKNIKRRKRIVLLLNNLKIGTKNLPDALKWHCSYYWQHCLPRSEIKKSLSTKKKLEECIAIPINYKISLKRYKNLCKKILLIK